MNRKLLRAEDEQLLLDLLRIPTVSPMETGAPSAIQEAQNRYFEHAVPLGFAVVYHAPAPASALEAAGVPLPVKEMAARMGPAFLESQPNLVLRLGRPQPTARTLVFNFHVDTVAGEVAVRRDDDRVTGRGAIDMKGPGVALLAGVRAGLSRAPDLTRGMAVLIQCVSGEEGGAMGVYGTRALVQIGWVGRLNVFAEPSEGVYFDHATASMTAALEVRGEGATDDEPQAGHNASVLLGWLACDLSRRLAEQVREAGGKMCVAGLHTGTMHNRVYGTGRLLFNFAYDSPATARRVRAWVEEAFAASLRVFRTTFAGASITARAATDAEAICRLTWLKEGLPVLANRDPAMERVLARAGWTRNPESRKDRAFTCDAMWGQGLGRYSVVYGPGSLGGNGAHTDNECVDLNDLEAYAGQVADLLLAFREDLDGA